LSHGAQFAALSVLLATRFSCGSVIAMRYQLRDDNRPPDAKITPSPTLEKTTSKSFNFQKQQCTYITDSLLVVRMTFDNSVTTTPTKTTIVLITNRPLQTATTPKKF